MCYRDIVAPGSDANEVSHFYDNFLRDIFPRNDLFMLAVWFPAVAKSASQEVSDVVVHRVISPLAKVTHVVLCHARKRDLDSHPTVWDDILDLVVPHALKLRREEGQDPGQPLYLTVHVGANSRFYELRPRATQAVTSRWLHV